MSLLYMNHFIIYLLARHDSCLLLPCSACRLINLLEIIISHNIVNKFCIIHSGLLLVSGGNLPGFPRRSNNRRIAAVAFINPLFDFDLFVSKAHARTAT